MCKITLLFSEYSFWYIFSLSFALILPNTSISVNFFRELSLGLLIFSILFITVLMLAVHLCCLSAPNLSLIALLMILEHFISSLSEDTMLNCVSRGRWRDIARERGFSSWFQYTRLPTGSCVVQDTQWSSPLASFGGTSAGTFPVRSVGAPAGL